MDAIAAPIVKSKAPIDVEPYLDRLEEAIDIDWERQKLTEWKSHLNFEPRPDGGRFDVRGAADGAVPSLDWPEITTNEAIGDPAKMLLHQLGGAMNVICGRGYLVPSIRTNYGTGIIATLFGARVFWMDEELGTLPTTWPFDGDDAMKKLLAGGMPDLDGGFGGRCFETLSYFQEKLAPYPKLSEAVWIYHPDLQGPIDNAELIWGSSMFYAFYEQPDTVKAVTELITDTYIAFLDRWLEATPERDPDFTSHWSLFMKGHVMLRDDSIMNLSPDMYREFVKPYDERILARYGGGGIHFCGRADHCIDMMTDSPNLTMVNMSQPHLNDMKRIYDATIGKGIALKCPVTEEMSREFDFSRGLV